MSFAVIGLGRMGLRHVEAARRLGMEIIGAADINPIALQAVQDQHGVANTACFTDANEMLKKVRPKALVISTTAPTHAQFVLAAAELGVGYVLCEKPIATSMVEAEAMVSACDCSGTCLAVNHQMRYMQINTKIKALIGSQELGPLVSIVIAGSNFGLAMNVIHYFEKYRYFTGESLCDVQAWFEDTQLANPRGTQFSDRSGRLLARCKSGLPMFIDFSVSAGSGINTIYICRNGQILVDELNGDMRIIARQAQYRDLPTTRYGTPVDIFNVSNVSTDIVAATMALWDAFLAGHDFPDGKTAIYALSCVVAAHASHESSGRVINIDDLGLMRERIFNWA